MSEATALAGNALINSPTTAAVSGAAPYAMPLAALHMMPLAATHIATAPRPVHYAVKKQAVRAAWAARAMESGVATARLIATGRAFDSPLDLLRMQHAMVNQLHQLGQAWIQGLNAWVQECSQLKAANTMSKIAEQEFDLMGQLTKLATDQMTAVINLMEGAQVGYGYWVQEKLDA